MARAKRTSKGAVRTAREEEELSPEEWELVDFIEEIGPTIARVYIWRVPKHGDHEYIDKVEVSDLKNGAEEYLRDTYGAPCKYFLRFKGSDNRWKFSKMINIGTPNKDQFLNGQPSGQLSSPAAVNAAREEEYRKELALMQARQHETFLAIIQSNSKQPAPAMPDPAAMLTAVVTAFTAIKGSTTPDGGFDLKKFREIIGVVNDLKSDKAPEENVYTVVKDLGQKVVETVQAWRQPAGALPPAVETVAAPAAENGGGRKMPTLQDWLRTQLAYMKQKALADKDVEAWIDYVMDNEEEPGCGAILHVLKSGATFENLLQFDPEIAQNPKLLAWFKTLYDGLLSEIKGPVDTAGGAGDQSNAGGHAATSTPGGPASGSGSAGGQPG